MELHILPLENPPTAPNKILCVPLVTVILLHTIKQQLQGYEVWPLNIISRPLIISMTRLSHLFFVICITMVIFPFICRTFLDTLFICMAYKITLHL